MPGAGDTDLGIDIDKELGNAGKANQPQTSDKLGPPVEEDLSHLSARERSALKRKRKSGKPQGSSAGSGPPNKVRLVDSSASSPMSSKGGTPTPIPAALIKQEDTEGSGAYSEGGRVQAKEEIEEKPDLYNGHAVADFWPFTRLADTLLADLLSSAWEVRHGAALGLRELLKAQGAAAGMRVDLSSRANAASHRQWVDKAACQLYRVLVLDRFGDFLGDQVGLRILSSLPLPHAE